MIDAFDTSDPKGLEQIPIGDVPNIPVSTANHGETPHAVGDLLEARTDHDGPEGPTTSGVNQVKEVRKPTREPENLRAPDGTLPHIADDPEDDIPDADFERTHRYEIYDTLKNLNPVPLDERRKKAKRNLMHAMTHQLLSEDRVKDLEEQLSTLRRHVYGEDDPEGARKEASAASLVFSHLNRAATYRKMPVKLQPARLTWDQFDGRDNLPAEKANAFVELLVEPPDLSRRQRKAELHSRPATQPKEVTSAKSRSAGQVYRIRINSLPLCEVFEQIMGKDYALEQFNVIIRPFKPIFAYWENLEDLCAKLQVDVMADAQQSEANGDLDGRPTHDLPSHNGVTVNQPSAVDDGVPTDDSAVGDQPEKNADFVKYLHLKAFLDMVQSDLAAELTMRNALRARSCPNVAFNDIWHLFAPGDRVYDKERGGALLLTAVVNGRSVLNPQKTSWVDEEENDSIFTSGRVTEEKRFSLCLYGVELQHNGDGFVPNTIARIISPFEPPKRITELPVYPIEYLEESEREQPASTAAPSTEFLSKRGANYFQLVKGEKPEHRTYRGHDLGKVKQLVESDVIVDPKLYYEQLPDLQPRHNVGYYRGAIEEVQDTCGCKNDQCRADSWYDDRKVGRAQFDAVLDVNKVLKPRDERPSKVLSEDLYLFLPQTIQGYALADRTWHPLDVSLIQEIRPRIDSFKDLVLHHEHKKIVEGLVRMHSSGPRVANLDAVDASADEERRDDLVRGKGKGLIILLHGPPGVGKTSTAECVAEYTNRPLLSITCGDLGTTAEAVQENLEENFSFAMRWGCVMLLDEADVFLQARDRRDLERNAVVSVFLRALEYYSGILFLTTNKIGQFDEAFTSRIHISLHYPSLTALQTKQIWEVNLKRLKTNRPKLKIDQNLILDWARKLYNERNSQGRNTWNGRQIRNACQTAAALAEFQAAPGSEPELTEQAFELVSKTSREFDKYLYDLYGSDNAGRSRRAGDRFDHFGDGNDARHRDSIAEPYGFGRPRGAREAPRDDEGWGRPREEPAVGGAYRSSSPPGWGRAVDRPDAW